MSNLLKSLLLAMSVLVMATESPAAVATDAAVAEMVAAIESTQTSANQRAQACQDLGAVGTEAAVEPLARLLADPQFSHYARYGLQTNPTSAAGEALLQATNELKGDLLIGVVNSLAARKQASAVPRLSELATAGDSELAIAAAGALAEIGSDEALHALQQLPASKFFDPLVEGAERLLAQGSREQAAKLLRKIESQDVPAGQRRSVALALVEASSPEDANRLLEDYLASDQDWKFEVGVQCAVRSADSAATKLLASSLATSPAPRQLQLLAAIESRGDRSAQAAVRQAASSDTPEVRAAAIRTLGSIGDPTDVQRLVAAALAEDTQTRENAIAALGVLPGEQVRSELLSLLEDDNANRRLLAAQLMGNRRTKDVGPPLLEVAKSDDDSEVRLAAVQAITRLAAPKLLPGLLELAANSSGDHQQAAQRAVLATASRVANRDEAANRIATRLADADTQQYAYLCDALRSVGGGRSLEIVAEAAQSSNRELQNQATRVLGSWPTSDAAPVLFTIAQKDHPYRVRALRGYLRIARQLRFSDADRVKMVGQALEIATRDEERLLAISILTRYPSVTSLQLVEAQLAGNQLGEKAATPAVEIAEQVAPSDPAAAAKAAREVLKVSRDPSLRARAEQLNKLAAAEL